MDLKTFFEHFDTLAEAPNGIQRLRELILDMAVRGKLVPQDPEDEPAKLLIQTVSSVKKKYIESGCLPRKTPLPKSESEYPFELPNSWLWTSLGGILLKITDGTHHSPPNNSSGDYKYITAKNIKNEGISLHNITYVSKEIHESIYSRCDPEFGDVLYIKDGATTGVAALNTLREPFSMLSSVALLKVPQELLNNYLLYVLRSPFFYTLMRDDMSGIAITRVTLTKLNKALIPLPPLAEQKRIVAKVDELMALCDALEVTQQTRNSLRQNLRASALDALMNAPSDSELETAWAFVRDNWELMCDRAEDVEGLRKASLKIALRGKLTSADPLDDSVEYLLKNAAEEKKDLVSQGLVKSRKKELSSYELPWEIPKYWVAAPVDFVAFSLDHSRVPVNKIERFERQGNVPYYGANGQVGWIDRPLFDEPLVLVVEDETFIGRTKPFSYLISGPSWVNNHAHVLKPSSGILPDFLNFSLMYYPFAPLTSGTTGRRKLTQPTLLSVEIPIPPLREQKRIVKRVEEFWKLCDQLEDNLRQQHRKAESLAASAMSHLAT